MRQLEAGTTVVGAQLAPARRSSDLATHRALDGAGPSTARRRRERLIIGVTIALAAGALVWLTMARLTGSVSLFLSPDGGHYLTDADALIGDGVRSLAHPPAFPALVAASRDLVSAVGQVQLALAVSLWLLVVSLYLLCRQFAGVAASVAGAGIGATFPAIGELLSWNGGATLLATAFLVLALASTERWLRTGSAWSALGVGVASAAALLAHPFVAAVVFFCVGARWIVERVAKGPPYSLVLRRSPFSATHLAIVAAPVALALPVALPYYVSVEADAGVQLGVPRLGAMWDTLTWGLREQGTLLLVFLVLALAMAFGGRASATLAGALGAVYLVVSSASRADPSYRTRVAYLLPVVGAVGAAILFQRLAPPVVSWFTTRPRRRPGVTVAFAIVVVMVFASLGYLPRLPRAAAFYQRLDPVDLTALSSLSTRRGGLVAASWNQNAYGNGISNAWYVEGLARRKSAGPTDPTLSTIEREKVAGADMQRFFAGDAGVENGALQLATGPQGSFANPGLQAFLAGMYRPVFYVNDAVNGYPRPLGRPTREFSDLSADAAVEHHVTSSGMNGTYRAAGETSPQLTMTARLYGESVVFDYRHATADAEHLQIRLFPGYGVLWRDVRQDRDGFSFVTDPFSLTGVSTAEEHQMRVRVRTIGAAQLRFVEREPQFGLQSVEVTPDADGRVAFRVSFDTTAEVHEPRRFSQAELIRKYDITDVVLWKDTGWKSRFSSDPCFDQTQETRRLLIYDIDQKCAARR